MDSCAWCAAKHERKNMIISTIVASAALMSPVDVAENVKITQPEQTVSCSMQNTENGSKELKLNLSASSCFMPNIGNTIDDWN